MINYEYTNGEGDKDRMHIQFTTEAIGKLQEKLKENQSRYVKLKYDTDGCGCVMSGVTALWLVEEVESDDVKVETNDIPLYVERTKMVFLDEELTISFNASANCYMLKSPSQILNPRMSLLVK